MDFIFRPKASKDTESHFFCLVGYEDYLDDNGRARSYDNSTHICAKIVPNKKSKSIHNQNYNAYYIKIDSNVKAYNPIEYYSAVNNKNEYNFINSVCKNKFIFKEVNQQIFEKYIQFLNTKNIAWLKEVERDLK